MPHLSRGLRRAAFQLPPVFQDYFLQVVQLCTGGDGSVHLVPETRAGKRGRQQGWSRARERWQEVEEKSGGKRMTGWEGKERAGEEEAPQ